jgi:hypothetical protein
MVEWGGWGEERGAVSGLMDELECVWRFAVPRINGGVERTG